MRSFAHPIGKADPKPLPRPTLSPVRSSPGGGGEGNEVSLNPASSFSPSSSNGGGTSTNSIWPTSVASIQSSSMKSLSPSQNQKPTAPSRVPSQVPSHAPSRDDRRDGSTIPSCFPWNWWGQNPSILPTNKPSKKPSKVPTSSPGDIRSGSTYPSHNSWGSWTDSPSRQSTTMLTTTTSSSPSRSSSLSSSGLSSSLSPAFHSSNKPSFTSPRSTSSPSLTEPLPTPNLTPGRISTTLPSALDTKSSSESSPPAPSSSSSSPSNPNTNGGYSVPPTPGGNSGTTSTTSPTIPTSVLATVAVPQACLSKHAYWIGDGWCDADLNIAACQYDGGDCCLQTCSDDRPFLCGLSGYKCLDSNRSPALQTISLYFYLRLNTSLTENEDTLKLLISLAIDPYLSKGKLDITSVSMKLSANTSNSQFSALYPIGMLSTPSVNTNWTVDCSIIYDNAYEDSGDTVYFISQSVASGDLEKVIHFLAQKFNLSQFVGLKICSDASTCDNPYEPFPTAETSKETCKQSSAGWDVWYGQPSSLPFPVVWHFLMSVLWSSLVLKPLHLLGFVHLRGLELVCIASHLLTSSIRVAYHVYLVVEAMQPGGFDEMACDELSFTNDEEADSVSLDISHRLESSFFWTMILNIILGVVIGLLAWEVTLLALGVSFQSAREICQTIVGGVLVLLGFLSNSRTFSVIHYLLPGYLPCLDWLVDRLTIPLVVGLCGVITIVTAWDYMLTFPAVSLLLYTVFGRVSELICLGALQASFCTSPNDNAVQQKAGKSVNNETKSVDQAVERGRYGAFDDDDVDDDSEKNDDEDEKKSEEKEEVDLFPLDQVPRAPYRHRPSHSRQENTLVSDRVYPGPSWPQWVGNWTNRDGQSIPTRRIESQGTSQRERVDSLMIEEDAFSPLNSPQSLRSPVSVRSAETVGSVRSEPSLLQATQSSFNRQRRLRSY
eukprot:scaffold6421_cov251-Ochromonas_danica.AAC.26